MFRRFLVRAIDANHSDHVIAESGLYVSNETLNVFFGDNAACYALTRLYVARPI
jgi:hypothetical protein